MGPVDVGVLCTRAFVTVVKNLNKLVMAPISTWNSIPLRGEPEAKRLSMVACSLSDLGGNKKDNIRKASGDYHDSKIAAESSPTL